MSDEITSGMTHQEHEVATGSSVAAPPAPPVPPAPPSAPAAVPPGRSPGARGWRTGGILFGILLVVVGLMALFGGVTSIFDLLRFWPLLIVFGGIARMVDPHGEAFVKRVAEGLGSVAIGLVLLGNTLGYIRWTVWIALASLWPLLVIAIGVELVGRGLHMNWLRALSNVVLILGLAYGVFVLQYAPGAAVFPFGALAGPSTTFADAKPHDASASSGRASIKVGGTGLSVTAGEVLASVGGRAPQADKPSLEAAVANGVADVTISEPGNHTVVVGAGNSALDLTLDRALRWSEVRFDVGAVSAVADLSDLHVERVVLNAGASDFLLKLGNLADAVDVQASGGAMSLTIRVPASAACSVHATSGLSEVGVPPSFRRTTGIPVLGDSTFVSDGTGGPTITITLTSGVSDIRIETY
ncbi:MAG TPA: DUF5668 domain-containing protein [Coriobacteriia bacterium]